MNKLIFIFSIVMACSLSQLTLTQESMYEQKMENLRAFAKLYGYVRFFHPGDEAAATDWDKFAIYGMKYVESSADNEELKHRLEELFHPIASSVDVFLSTGEYKYDLNRIIPADVNGLVPVSWQHKGLGISERSIYKSVRVNRITAPENSFGTITKSIDAAPYRGRKIRIKGIVLADVEGENNHGHLWLRVDKKDGSMGFFDNMDDRPIRSDKWNEYEIKGDVAQDAVSIVFGCFLSGEGFVFVDKIELEVKNGNKWEKVDFENSDFEKDKTGSPPSGWNRTQQDYIVEVINYFSETGKQSCKIESKYQNLLFEKYPQPGEYFVKQISGGLSCAVPLCLYSDMNGTIPKADKELLGELNNSIYSMLNKGEDENVKYTRLGDIAIAWNVLQHSYPYFELNEIDWQAALGNFLFKAHNCMSEKEFASVLEEMIALLNDGHGSVYNSMNRQVNFYPPFLADFAEGVLVVSRLFEENTGLLEGDIITEIDGRTVSSLVQETGTRISASTPQWRKVVQLRLLLRKSDNTKMILKLRRGSEQFEKTVDLNYTFTMIRESGAFPEYRPEKMKEIEKGIFYVDMERAAMKEINAIMDKLAASDGVIFDMRGYPNSTHEVLCHLSDIPLTSAMWNVPLMTYPDMENLVGYDTTGRWKMEPLSPRIKGKVIFLTYGGAISYAESVLGIVEAYKLGTIVGETTAGTNGNVNTINLPGGYVVNYTGMKVLKHDGSQHHGLGIKPDVEVHRSIKGVKEKRDEFLEKAIEIIKGN